MMSLFVVAIHLFVATAAAGQTISFARVVDTDVQIPGFNDNFGGLPAFFSGDISGSRVYFGGGNQLGTISGPYEIVNGSPTTIADVTTQIPSGSGTFSGFRTFGLSANQGDMVFEGGNQEESGIYSRFDGQLGVIADRNTQMPGSAVNFRAFGGQLSLAENRNAVFRGSNGSFSGVYQSIAGTLSRVADTNTPVPSGSGNFTVFGSGEARVNDAVFTASGASGQRGIYQSVGGSLSMIYNTQTPVPSGVGAFSSFSRLSVDGGDLAFFAFNTVGERQGIFKRINGVLSTVADLTTDAPEGALFRALGLPLISNDVVVFSGETDEAFTGIYADIDGSLQTIIRGGDMLDGVMINDVTLFPGAFSDNQLLIYVRFIDDTEFHANQALYVVTIPVPPSMMLGAAALAGLAGRRARR